MAYGKEPVHILDVMEVVASHEVAPWVREAYMEKFHRYLGDSWGFLYNPDGVERLPQIMRILQQLPEGPDIAAEYAHGVKNALSDDPKSDERTANLKALLKLAEKGKPPNP